MTQALGPDVVKKKYNPKNLSIMAKAYIFLAEGFEEIEALTPVDLLRRAGVDAKFVAVGDSLQVTGANGITIVADMKLDAEAIAGADLLVCPGGMPGASNLAACGDLGELLVGQAEAGRLVAAICAAPAVTLAPLGVLRGKNATCYPGFEPMLEDNGACHKAERVVRDGNIITANGPSSAFPFGLALIDALCGGDVEQQIAVGTLQRFPD